MTNEQKKSKKVVIQSLQFNYTTRVRPLTARSHFLLPGSSLQWWLRHDSATTISMPYTAKSRLNPKNRASRTFRQGTRSDEKNQCFATRDIWSVCVCACACLYACVFCAIRCADTSAEEENRKQHA